MLPVGLGWRHSHYAELLAQRPRLDFLEVHSENFFGEGGAALAVLAEGRAHYPVSLHGVGLSLGSAMGIDPTHLDQLATLVERIDPVRVSDHASFARVPWQGGALHAADLLPVPWTHEALAVMAANVQRVQERLRRPIAVENLSAYLAWSHADWSEPDFLTELARRTGCELLVDVNNLMVNALNTQGRDTPAVDLVAGCCAWLDALGTVAVAELHVAGHALADPLVIDDHGSRVSEPVWQVHAHALRCFGPVPTLVEWDTDIPELAVLLAEVQRAREAA